MTHALDCFRYFLQNKKIMQFKEDMAFEMPSTEIRHAMLQYANSKKISLGPSAAESLICEYKHVINSKDYEFPNLCYINNRIFGLWPKCKISLENKWQWCSLNDFIACCDNYQPEIELKTFIDCLVKIGSLGRFNIEIETPLYNHVQKIEAFSKLLIIKHALQGYWEPEMMDDRRYTISYGEGDKKLCIVSFGATSYNPFNFRTRELAQKSIDIGEDIWYEYFGIKKY